MNQIRAVISMLTGLILIILLVFVFVLDMDFTGSTVSGDAIDFTNDWRDENGKRVVLNELEIVDGDREILLRHNVDGSELTGESLCFASHNVVFYIYADGRLIYDFHPELGGIYGKFYGTCIHTVSLPSLEEDSVITMECELLDTNKWKGFEDMKIEQSGSYINGIFKENMGKFLICLVMFVFGTILFFLGLAECLVNGKMFETMCLGIVTMLLSVWTHSQTYILHILTGNTTALRIVEYLVLAFLPIPMMMFISSFMNCPNNKLILADIGLCIINCIMQVVLVSSGVFDYVDLLTISHGLILLSAAIAAYITRKAVTTNAIDRSQRRYLLTSFVIIVASGILDMLRYYVNASHDAAEVTRIGLIIFVSILAYYELMQLISVRIKSRESEVMQKLAMEDPLTGMQNRTAFTAYEKLMMERITGQCMFIHFDVNCLKKVNDTYGHAAGDRHIIAAANVIQKSFGGKGKCFRVGGDEFFAVLDTESFNEDYESGLEQFRKLQEEYNASEEPPVKLSIAHGAAVYSYALRNTDAVIKVADGLMYEDKQRMKAAAVSQ